MAVGYGAINSPSAIRISQLLLDWLILGGLLLTLAVLPLQTFGSQFSIGMCLVLLFLWGGQAIVRKRAVIVRSPLHFTLLAFLGVVMLQLVPLPFQIRTLSFTHSFKDLPVPLDQWNTITLDRQVTSSAAVVLASLIGYFFIAANSLHAEKRLRLFVNGLIFIGFALSFLGVLDRFSSPGGPLLRGISSFGLYYFSLGRLAGYIEMVFPLPLAMILAGAVRRDDWALYGLAAITIGVAVTLADATGGLFVLAVELVSLFLLVFQQRSQARESSVGRFSRVWTSVVAMLIVGLIISGTVWLGTRSIPRTIASDVTGNFPELGKLEKSAPFSDYNYYNRSGFWKTSFRMIKDHPLVGVGFGVYSIAYTLYDPGSGVLFVNAAHNDYLQLLCETGLIGGVTLILFFAFLVRVSRGALMSARPFHRAVSLGASVGCLGILVHSLADFHLQSPGTTMLFLMLVALLVSVKRMQDIELRNAD